MAELEAIEDRLISGTGVLRVPSEEKKLRYALLTLDVIRPPSNEYLNFNYAPPRSRYAFLTYMRKGYVIGSGYMEFERQAYDTIADISGQNLIAIKCAYEGILTTLFNLGNALGLPSISYTDLIADYDSLNLQWDEVRIRCYADTAIQARLYKLNYDACNPDKDDQFAPPPLPPPLPKLPPKTPIGNIDAPYDDDPDNPDETTSPNPIDSTVPPVFAVTAQYRPSTNCSAPLVPVVYYFDSEPLFTQGTGRLCGISNYTFSPIPFGYDYNNTGYVSPVVPALYNGSSFYGFFSPAELVPDPRA